MDLELTVNFNMKEFTHSDIAGIEIVPTDIQIERIRKLCQLILQPIRFEWGPVVITGGLRNGEVYKKLLSDAKQKRREGFMVPLPSLNSDHFAGDPFCPKGTGAADFIVKLHDHYLVYKWIISQKLYYKQLIYYVGHSFIHISNADEKEGPKRENLIYEDGSYYPYDDGKEEILS